LQIDKIGNLSKISIDLNNINIYMIMNLFLPVTVILVKDVSN